MLEAFADGGPALAYLKDGGAADLIFLDLRMPNVDGWTFLAEDSVASAMATSRHPSSS